ncbi:MAG: DUF4238 domain-containing protein [Bacteroidia bacterium]
MFRNFILNSLLTASAALNLQSLVSSLEVATDLACKLIINNSDISFITCDNPVIRYNQFLEKRKFPGGREGLAIKGLQIFYPICPSLALLFYDNRVYKIGYKKQQSVVTSNSNDISSKPNNLNISVPVYVFTKSGSELLRLVKAEAPIEYLTLFVNSFKFGIGGSKNNVEIKYSNITSRDGALIHYDDENLMDFPS